MLTPIQTPNKPVTLFTFLRMPNSRSTLVSPKWFAMEVAAEAVAVGVVIVAAVEDTAEVVETGLAAITHLLVAAVASELHGPVASSDSLTT